MTNAETRDYSALSDRELDALVAERVMEWERVRRYEIDDVALTAGTRHDGRRVEVPFYSTTWEGAGLVLEAMRERGWRWAVYPAASGPAIAATFSR